jgi:hypothetical protein
MLALRRAFATFPHLHCENIRSDILGIVDLYWSVHCPTHFSISAYHVNNSQPILISGQTEHNSGPMENNLGSTENISGHTEHKSCQIEHDWRDLGRQLKSNQGWCVFELNPKHDGHLGMCNSRATAEDATRCICTCNTNTPRAADNIIKALGCFYFSSALQFPGTIQAKRSIIQAKLSTVGVI